MYAIGIVIVSVGRKNSAQVRFPTNDDMIQTFAPDRSDDALDVTVLPWRANGNLPITNSHASETPLEGVARQPVVVADEACDTGAVIAIGNDAPAEVAEASSHR